MAKLTLNPAPTFRSKVPVPIAGGGFEDVEFTFKHKAKTALIKFDEERGTKDDVETFMDMVSGWELEDKFNKESVGLLLENYFGVWRATYLKYVEELTKAKAGN